MRTLSLESKDYLRLIKLCNQLLFSFRYIIYTISISEERGRYIATLSYVRP